MSLIKEIAYLGPVGTYTYVAAKKRYGNAFKLKPKPTISQVFEYVRERSERLGIVPLENSSGGLIEDTVDFLGAENPQLKIREELRLRVQLALLGHTDANPEIIYSHFAPLRHCRKWLRDNLPPEVEEKDTPSTTAAAEMAAKNPLALALAHPMCGELYNLDIIHFPVSSDEENVTQFAVIGHESEPLGDSSKSSYLVELVDEPGSLCSFLTPFKDNGVNLTRLHSRPVRGTINRYKFFITIDGGAGDKNINSAWQAAKKNCLSILNFGSYPVSSLYES